MINSWKKKEPITAFIDADATLWEPQYFIRNCLSVRIIAVSSPKGTEGRWMKKLPNSSHVFKFVTTPWSPEELFLTGFVLSLVFECLH